MTPLYQCCKVTNCSINLNRMLFKNILFTSVINKNILFFYLFFFNMRRKWLSVLGQNDLWTDWLAGKTWDVSTRGPFWSWLYGSWIHNYLCNQCLSPLKLWVWRGVLDTSLNLCTCNKVCQWLVTGWWFSLWVLRFLHQ